MNQYYVAQFVGKYDIQYGIIDTKAMRASTKTAKTVKEALDNFLNPPRDRIKPYPKDMPPRLQRWSSLESITEAFTLFNKHSSFTINYYSFRGIRTIQKDLPELFI